MFRLSEVTERGVRRILLVNTGTEEYISLIPEFGLTVSAVVLRGAGRLIPVLDGYLERKDLLKDDAYRGVHLIPFASRIADGRFVFEGRSLQLPVNDPAFAGAIHGFWRDRSMSLAGASVDDEGITARFSSSYRGEVAGYPFPFEAAFACRLRGSEGVSFTIEVTNTGSGTMPLSVGWHPYWRLDAPVDDLIVGLPVLERILLNDRMVPSGERTDARDLAAGVPLAGKHFDGIFRVDPGGGRAVTRLRNPLSGLSLDLWQETGRDKFNYLVVYTPPDRRSVALEPLTSNVDAFNNGEGLIVLAPGAIFRGSYGISLAYIPRTAS